MASLQKMKFVKKSSDLKNPRFCYSNQNIIKFQPFTFSKCPKLNGHAGNDRWPEGI